jgi:hypothetical protein
MALASFLAGSAERDALVKGHIVANNRSLANDDTHPVVNKEASADHGAGMNFNASQESREMRKHPRHGWVTVRPEGVGQPIEQDGVKAGVGEEDLDGRAGRWIALFDDLNIFSDLG